jgi:UDP-N-acetylmuramoylalanine--D-glutamate ligase
MPEAVQQAQQLIPTDGGVILMSPASASFGLFKNYHERGLKFQEAVKDLVEKV